MDSKLSQRLEIPILVRSRVLHASLPPVRFCLESLENKKRLLAKTFRGLSESWNAHIQERLKDQHSSNQFLLHVVKEGETLTSISRQYGVSIQSIVAVNEKLVDIDLVFRGQHLNIPSPSTENAKNFMWKIWSERIYARHRWKSSFNILDGSVNHKISTVLPTHHLLPAKATGYFLVLVPLVAFCIRCIIGAIHHKVAEDLKHQVVNESDTRQHGSRCIRWKSALSDIREPDVLGAESMQNSTNTPEDQPPVPFEEMSHAYTELEPAYQKFLSDCGMSETGYWRGGSPE